MDIENLKSNDPFMDMEEPSTCMENITIHTTKRNAKKYITVVENLNKYIDDLPKFLKYIKKKCACNGTYIKGDEILQFQGQKKYDIMEILRSNFDIPANRFILRGV